MQFAFAALLGLLVFSGTASASTPQHHKAKTPAKQQDPASPPQADPTPPIPLTPAQMPSNPPQVSYTNGSLIIVARNSTLGDILRAVRSQTGADVDIPGNANERVMSSFGPGNPRDVLAQLLNGSDFNYVMLGSPSDAGLVQKLILTPKAGDQASTQAPNQPPTPEAGAPNPFPRIQPPPGSGQPQEMSSEDDAEDSNDGDAQDDQAVTAPAAANAGEQPAGQAPNQPAVKTPEQLLQDLQRQQQQQQQQTGGAQPADPTPPNQR